MPLPISRDSMRTLREQTLEEDRKVKIQTTVSIIYSGAVNTAQKSTYSKYLYEFSDHHPDAEFYRTHMSEIVAELQSLFPDCSVKHTRDIREISDIDEQRTQLTRFHQSGEYIVVDWS
jgi:hypothetical protein